MKIKIATGFIIFIGIFTIFTIWLFLIDVWQNDDEEKIILVAAISLIGALVGGVISGGLTLAGVYYSISNERDIRLKESYPIQKRNADKVEIYIRDVLVILYYLNEKTKIDHYYESETIISLLKDLEKDTEEIFDYASKVDGYYFTRVSDILMYCAMIKGMLTTLPDTDDEKLINYFITDISKMVKDIEILIKEIRNHLDDMGKVIT